jgi:hypothetical protein
MRLPAATAVVVLATVCVVPNVGRGDDVDPAIRAGTKLLEEGDRQADQGNFTEAVIRYKRGFEQLLPRLRRLPFQHEVKRDVTKRENLKALILKEIEEEMTPEEFRANEMALKAFGLIPRDFKLKEALAQVYAEEVAAFYDPKTKTMHLIEEPKADTQKPPSFLERLFGRKTGFDKKEHKTIIAHELTHALSDQHYDIDALQKRVKKDDDRSLAVEALVEGEATLTMFAADMEDWRGVEIVKTPAEGLDFAFSLMAPFLPFMGGGKSLREAPPIIGESMIFPYLKGMVFCAKLANDGGWKAIDDAYRNPPFSTEQVLHPEKYLAQPDLPMAIELGALAPGRGWIELGRNVLGEMQLSVLLRKHNGKAAAAGWDGDKYGVFEGPQNRLGLVWLSTWDSEQDAREFAREYIRYQSAKLGRFSLPFKRVPDIVHRTHAGAVYVVERRGLDVAVIEGFGPEATASLLEAAMRAKKTEMRPEAPAAQPAGARAH